MTYKIEIEADVFEGPQGRLGTFWVHMARDGKPVLARKTSYGEFADAYALAGEALNIAETMVKTLEVTGLEVNYGQNGSRLDLATSFEGAFSS